MQTEGNLPLPDTTVTVAELLKQAGYRTAVIGKWGLGGPGSSGGPNSQGFEYSYCYLDQRNAHEYYPPYLWENEQKVMLDNQPDPKEYSHDLFTLKALEFIEKQGDMPVFLYLAYTIPHGKHQVPDDAPYSDRGWAQNQKNYAAMITRMDRDIGSIMDLLKLKGIDAQTIVFFTSDNGGTRQMSDFFRSNGESRGYKGDLFEGGIRVPLIVRWPGRISAGSVSSHISAFWDFLPTVCELAGADRRVSTGSPTCLYCWVRNRQNMRTFTGPISNTITVGSPPMRVHAIPWYRKQ
jgi:arylsulfatase A-like enzyme